MRVELELELRDVPGTLAPVLDAVAEHGANILSVVHRHELAEDGRVPVRLAVDVPEENALRLIDALARKHRILRVDQEGGPVRTSVLLAGHVFQAHLDELLEPVFEGGAEVERIDARIAGRDSPSAVMLDVSAASEEALREALATLRQGAEAAGLTVMEAVQGDADV